MKANTIFSIVFFSGSLLLTGCNKSNSSTPAGNQGGTPSTIISIRYMAFSPASKTVKKGTKVEWDNYDGSAHTATSNDGVTFNTGNIPANGSASYTANTTGTFNYHCTIHGVSMSGTLIVTP